MIEWIQTIDNYALAMMILGVGGIIVLGGYFTVIGAVKLIRWICNNE